MNNPFNHDYSFAAMNELADEGEAEVIVNMLGSYLNGDKLKTHEFVATLMLASATLISACVNDEATACIVSRHCCNYLHDATHTMFGGEAEPPSPTVPFAGNA